MKTLRDRSGQFFPIAMFVVFTTVMLLVVVVNVYTVAKEKLKVQNLADAVALNVASQMASSLNKVSDLNEWMNNMLPQPANAPPRKPGQIPNCSSVNPDIPPISCAENATNNGQLNMFSLKGNAAAYAGLVQTVNSAQQMFIDAYNNFIGAGTGSNSSISSNSSLQSILFADIPDLQKPGTSVTVGNDQNAIPGPQAGSPATSPASGAAAGSIRPVGMLPLKFRIHDITVTYKTVIPILNVPGPNVSMSLGQLLSAKNQPVTPVGWMEQDPNQPAINLGSGATAKSRIGVWAVVSRSVPVPLLGARQVVGKAQAYIVLASGQTADLVADPLTGLPRPVFKPTYWVKLTGAK